VQPALGSAPAPLHPTYKLNSKILLCPQDDKHFVLASPRCQHYTTGRKPNQGAWQSACKYVLAILSDAKNPYTSKPRSFCALRTTKDLYARQSMPF
jgi:hypothetical protein